MKRKKLAAFATAILTGAALIQPFTAAQGTAAAPGASPERSMAPDREGSDQSTDNLRMPWQRKYDELKQTALQQQLRAGNRRAVHKLAKGQFAKTAQTGEDRIFVVLAEFGDTRHTAYCDDVWVEGENPPPKPCTNPSDGTPQRYDGPLHNQIPEPDRSKDNSTLWQADYDRDHYQNMYFNRMRKFYEKQSLGKYSFSGDVTEWVKVPFNEARYGRDACGDIVCSNTWQLLRDALNLWVEQQLDAGKTMPEIQTYLKSFDKQDRYDFDEDGNFNEPDGFIDHMQIVHSGGDQADGDPYQGTDAIWSHRWYAGLHGGGPTGGAQFGGFDIGEPGAANGDVTFQDHSTGVWVGDYTIQPENGGLSVFAHEYGHDLGLPDLYDTSGNTGGAENSMGWWSLMSQSRGTLPKDNGIGDRPMPFGAWDKFQLGWLDYAVMRHDRSRKFALRPGQQVTKKGINGVIVLLPNKEVTLELGAPCAECGSAYYYSDSGNDLNNTMTREIDAGGELTAKVRYEIEAGWDYAFLESSSDGGATWDPVETSESYEGADSSGFNASGTGISGDTGGAWVDLTATVPADANAVRWRYQTDGAAAEQGFQVDNIAIDGTDIGTAEAGPEGWELDGFRTTTGSEPQEFLNAYFVDNRTYQGLDKPLSHLYNFGFADTKPDWVEFFHNQPGALITYWDTSQTDNNVGDHPGEGEILPVDANPNFIHTPDGEIARPRINTWDSTFTPKRAKGQTLHFFGEPYRLPGHKGTAVFNDNRDWWFSMDEHGTHEGDHYKPGWYSVNVPKTGTRIKIAKITRKGMMTVKVN
jgi:immune inhibitor A